jgi:CRP-like cAMP-binding protein
MGSEHTDFAALDAALTEARIDQDYGRVLSLVAANLSDASGAPHLIRYTAEALVELERPDDAAELYIALARYALDIDRPLDAVIALDALAALRPDAVQELIQQLLERYSAGSVGLETGHTPVALPNDGAVMVEPIGEDDVPLDVRVENALLACGAVLEDERSPLPASPIPLLSDLGAQDLMRVVLRLEPEMREESDVLMIEGLPVSGLWWLARGGMIVQSRDLGTRALTGPNILLGLEALSDQRSPVTATCLGRCDLLYLDSEALVALMNESLTFRRGVQQLIGRYELHQAVSRSELFRQLAVERHAELLGRFSAFSITAGQVLVSASAPSPGLFLLTSGAVELRVDNGEAGRVVGRLEAGQMFGLDGLQPGAVANLTAVATDDARVLFLDRTHLGQTLEEHPDAERILWRMQADAELVARALAG